MRVPPSLSLAFGADFEKKIAQFASEQELMPNIASLHSPRFLARSVVPHVLKLSALFNRTNSDQIDQASALDPYWKNSSHPSHLKLAYLLYFMPCNLFRIASVWAELARLGFRWQPSQCRAIEFGSGPATGPCGIATGEQFTPIGLPLQGNWALIEQDKANLDLGVAWATTYFDLIRSNHAGWGLKPFHRKLDPLQQESFLPPRAPRFHLWIMSFYLNEINATPEQLASLLLKDWTNHLEEEGVILLIEPALKLQSRRLLALRNALLAQKTEYQADWLQILLPCLGHQACGAFAQPDDWCHEEVNWWRPPYLRVIDKMAGLDRKNLPFSYLVLTKSRRPREELLPALKNFPSQQRHRLVSPAHTEGQDLEFFTCGQEGKRRARFRPSLHSQDLYSTFNSGKPQNFQPSLSMHPETENPFTENASPVDLEKPLQRGDILLGSEIRGDFHASRIQGVKKILI